jgi:hypothetical protein
MSDIETNPYKSTYASGTGHTRKLSNQNLSAQSCLIEIIFWLLPPVLPVPCLMLNNVLIRGVSGLTQKFELVTFIILPSSLFFLFFLRVVLRNSFKLTTTSLTYILVYFLYIGMAVLFWYWLISEMEASV